MIKHAIGMKTPGLLGLMHIHIGMYTKRMLFAYIAVCVFDFLRTKE